MALEPFKKLASTLVLLLRGTINSELEIFKIAQNTTPEAKEPQYTTGKVIQRLVLVHAHIYRYIADKEANDESNTFIIKLQTVTETDCAGSLW